MSSKSAPEPARWSLATRLTAWYAGSAFLLILTATSFLYWVLLSNLDREDDQFLVAKVSFLRVLLRDRPDDAVALARQVAGDEAAPQYSQMLVRVRDAAGRTLLETPGMAGELPPEAFPEPPAATDGASTAVEVEGPSGKTYRLLAARAPVGNSGEVRLLQLGFDRTYEENLLARYRRNLWLVLGTALVACAAAGYWIARRGLRPVAEITETAGRIRPTTLHERLQTAGLPAELQALALTFNDMLDRLQESFDRLARFSADIAHELRTPMNNLRGEAEVALGRPRAPEEYRQVLGSCLEECQRLARLIDSLLFLARAERPQAEIVRERLRVRRELEAVRDFYEAAAAEAGVALAVEGPAAVEADLDRTLFQRAVGNLVANALAHTPAGGTVTLGVRDEGGTVGVTVADTGGGIHPEHLPHVFDRFYRADMARTTAAGRVGLGLAIVRSIAGLHGGSAAIASEVGRGTCVRLVFPSGRGAAV